MTISELGAIGEFVGSIAVLATLIYLATQIRQNTRSMEDNKKFAMAQAFQARCDMAIQVSHFQRPEIMARLAADSPDGGLDWTKVDDLSPEMVADVKRWLNVAHLISDNTCYQNELGLIPDDHFNSQNLSYLSMWYPGWQRVGTPISPRVQSRWKEFLEGQVANGPSFDRAGPQKGQATQGP